MKRIIRKRFLTNEEAKESESIIKSFMKEFKPLKSYKPLTQKQEGNIWAEIEVQADYAYKAGCDLDLNKLSNALFELNKLSKKLQRSNIGKLIQLTKYEN